MNELSGHFCPMPFTSIHVDPDGGLKPCCAFLKSYSNLGDTTILEYFNSNSMKFLREEFLAGKKPKECNVCWELEKHDGNSVRKSAILRLQEKNTNVQERVDQAIANNYNVKSKPIDFQIMYGNLCNLACKMCSGDYSTNYTKFFQNKGITTGPFVNNVGVPKHVWPDSWITEQFDGVYEELEHIFVTGGEPTINPGFLKLIEQIRTKNKKNQCLIQLSTNCTNINKEVLSSLEQSQVLVFCSLDGMDEIAYIQRTPSNWESIEKNLLFLLDWSKKQDKQVVINSVLTCLNFHHILDFWVHLYKIGLRNHFGYTSIEDPIELSINLIPRNFVEIIIMKCDEIKKSYNQLTYNCDNLKNYLIGKLDVFPSTDTNLFKTLSFYQSLHPELNFEEIYSFYNFKNDKKTYKLVG